MHAALALRGRGFTDVRSLRGGIQRWAMEIDPTMPQY
jgi:rhodanese-related sulfurtransferase